MLCASRTLLTMSATIFKLSAQFWISIFSQSYQSTQMQQSIRIFSETHWRSTSGKRQSILMMANLFFLRTTKFVSPEYCRCLVETFDNPEKCQNLHLELTAAVDAGVHFIYATNYLEGDGPLILTHYERLSTVTPQLLQKLLVAMPYSAIN